MYIGKYISVALIILMTLTAANAPDLSKVIPAKNFFGAPVGGKMMLSGNFGELRNNHFHEGLDIKPATSKVGDPILAAGEGFVSRVLVSPRGFGNCIYIDHPNGYTTVYAHLDKFNDKLSAHIRQKQLSSQNFKQDLKFGPKEFPVAKGETIGIMGNTGSSRGAHLHFEIRDTETECPINPLIFGFDVQDNIAPYVKSVRAYALDVYGRELKSQSYSLVKGSNGVYAPSAPIVINGDYAGLAMLVDDAMDNTKNTYGIYKLKVEVGDSLAFSFKIDAVSYDETRFMNAHIDYKQRGTKVHRCFRLPGNRLNIYDPFARNGRIRLPETGSLKAKITVADYHGNETVTEVILQKGKPGAVAKQPYNYLLPWNEPSVVKTDDIQLFFPEGTFYEDLYMQYSAAKDIAKGVYSRTHHVHNGNVPVHDYYDISIKPVNLPERLRDKVVIASCSDGASSFGGVWESGMLKAQVRTLGSFCIMADTIAPVITAQGKFVSGAKPSGEKIAFTISDNLSGIEDIDAWVNDQWVVMVYDQKSNRIVYTFDSAVVQGSNKLKVQVADKLGNTATFTATFLAD